MDFAYWLAGGLTGHFWICAIGTFPLKHGHIWRVLAFSDTKIIFLTCDTWVGVNILSNFQLSSSFGLVGKVI